VRLIKVKLPQLSLLIPLLLALLAACEHAGEAERVLAVAEEAKKAGQLQVAADLYHWAAELRPQDFDIQYRTALSDLKVGNFIEAEEHLKKNAVQWLQQALQLNPALAAEAQKADDLKSLFSDPEFLAVTRQ
jgi:tetratricopeptide (TPR) repeat protein